MNFREARGKRPRRINTAIEEGFSNFIYIDRSYQSHPVLRRIFSLARKLKFKSVLVERIEESNCSLLAEENAALAVRAGDFQKSVVSRISFFACSKEATPRASDFLGYAVFKNDFFASNSEGVGHVYECVIRPPRRPMANSFIHCMRDYKISTRVGEFGVRGVLYAQQNRLTFVCAHVALRSALACVLPSADLNYSKINTVAGIDHKRFKLGTSSCKGLEVEAIEEVLKGLNLNFSALRYEQASGVLLQNEFPRDLYGFIESGYPALLGFELSDGRPSAASPAGHMISVIGHTFQEDAWMPEAQRRYFGEQPGYFPSENWLSSYLIHDDNIGPYFRIPRHYLKQNNSRVIIGLKPCATPFNAVEAETVGFASFKSIVNEIPLPLVDWYDRFALFCTCDLLILRTMLVRKERYLKHLRNLETWGKTKRKVEPALLNELERRLPDTFWIVEASAQELFSASRRKFGEVLISATTPLPKPLERLDTSLLLAARLPGLVLLVENDEYILKRTRLVGHTDIISSGRSTPVSGGRGQPKR